MNHRLPRTGNRYRRWRVIKNFRRLRIGKHLRPWGRWVGVRPPERAGRTFQKMSFRDLPSCRGMFTIRA